MILQDLRKSIKPIMWVIAFAFIASLFFMYGPFFGEGGSEKPLVKVNNASISYASFLQAYRGIYDQYAQETEGEISPQIDNYLKSQALSKLISNEMLYQEAKKAKIKISKEGVTQQIKEVRRRFTSQEYFMRWLSYQGYTYSDFEEEIERQLTISRLTQRIMDSVIVTDEELKDYWALENERIEVEYLLLNPKEYVEGIKVTTEEAKKYYQDHEDDFEVPEKVKVQYILISPVDFRDTVEINEQTLEKYYQDHLDEFEVEEKRRASHILIGLAPSPTDEQEEEAKEKIEKIENEIKKGADFAELAKEYSEDPGSAADGGDLGFFTYQTMTPSFSKAVFSLEKIGEMSAIVKTLFGYHLIKLTGIQPSYAISFEKVREEIEAMIINQESREKAYQEIKEIKEEIDEGEISFEKYAREYPNRVKTAPFFSMYEQVEDFGWEPQFVQTAFSLKPGEISSLVESSRGYCIINLLEKKPPHILPWDEAEEEARQRVAENQAKKVTQQRALQLIEEFRKGKALSSFTKGWGYQKSDYFTRQDWVRGIATQDKEQFMRAAFSLRKEEISDPIFLTQGYYIIKLLDRKIPSFELIEEKDEFKEKILSRKRQNFLEAWFEKVREKTKIVDNTSLFFPSS